MLLKQYKRADALCDIHICRWAQGRPQAWFDHCLDRLSTAPVNVYIVQGYAGHGGLGRIDGYSYGGRDLVGVVDDDDFILPDCFESLVDVARRYPSHCGYYGDEILIDADGVPYGYGVSWYQDEWRPVTQILKFAAPHHPWLIWRRHVNKYVQRLKDWPRPTDYILHALITHEGSWRHVKQRRLPLGAGYAYRQHSDSLKRQNEPQQRQSALEFASHTLATARHV